MRNRERIEERRNEDGDVFKSLVTEQGTRYSYHDCIGRTEAAVRSVSRWFYRAIQTRTEWAERDWRKGEVERLRWLLDDVQSYVESALAELDRIEGVDRHEERIAKLREIAGRSPAEAAAYLEKAAELQARSS